MISTHVLISLFGQVALFLRAPHMVSGGIQRALSDHPYDSLKKSGQLHTSRLRS